MSEPISIEPSQADVASDHGFSLIEAIIVLAISSMLLLVLTSTISLARTQNLRLADHARLSGDKFYADLQIQALLDRLYIDPLLQAYGAQPSLNDRRAALHTEQSWSDLDSDVAFEGNSERFTFSTLALGDDEAVPQRVEIAWIDERDGRRMSMSLGGAPPVIWPVLYDSQTRFRFRDDEGELLDIFPEPPERSLSRRVATDPTLLPTSILAYRDDIGEVVFIVDVP